MNSNMHVHTSFVKSREQARDSLQLFLRGNKKADLEKGIFDLSSRLNSPILSQILEDYPHLLQSDSFEDLLSGKVEIEVASLQEMKTGVYICGFLFFTSFISELKDVALELMPIDKIGKANSAFEMAHRLIQLISLDEFLDFLYSSVFSAVGIEYYDVFTTLIEADDLAWVDLKSSSLDPRIEKHLDLMRWFTFMRLFLESIYVYFDPNLVAGGNLESKRVEMYEVMA